MKTLEGLEKSKSFWVLFLISFLFFVFRFPSLFEPYWYGDEGVYEVVGTAISGGRLLYRDIWDNKPPLLYMLYSSVGSDQFAVKLLSLFFGALGLFVFYKLCQKLFKSERVCLFATFFFSLLLGIPLLEGNIANAENFMVLPTLLSAFLLFNLKGPTQKNVLKKNLTLCLFSGFLLGISFLFKIVAVFDFGAFLFFLIFMDKNILKHLRNKKYKTYEVKKIIYFIFGFLFPPFITSLFFILKGAFPQFLGATFFSNIGYVGDKNSFLIPQGLLLIKVFLLLFFAYFLFSKRKSMSQTTIFALLWFSFSFFNAFFSQRPYTHYLLVLMPSFIILALDAFEEKKFRSTSLLILIIAAVLIFMNFSFYTKTIPYYGNFISFISGGENVLSYQNFFDRLTPLDYKLASFVRTDTKQSDLIFTWGNNAQLYKLTEKLPPGRFAVAYHITSAKSGILETKKILDRKKPKLIIVMPYMNFFPFALVDYTQRIIIDQALVYERNSN